LSEEKGPSPAEQQQEKNVKFLKAQTQMFKAMTGAASASPQLMAIFEGFQIISPLLEPVTMFFEIASTAFQAGLGEAIQALTTALFTEENIEIMTKLGQMVGELVSKGLVPLTVIIEKLLPIILKLIETFVVLIGKALDPLMPPLLRIIDIIVMLIEKLEPLLDVVMRLIDRLDPLWELLDVVFDKLGPFIDILGRLIDMIPDF